MSANGYLTAAELAPIDNGQFLRPDAATRYNALRAAAAADGVAIRTSEGYRDYATQVYYRNLFLAGQGNPAGIPGTSQHGYGLAVDINTTGFSGTVFNWMTANAGRFGFNNIQGRGDNEHWHWVYDGTGAAGLGGSATLGRRKAPEMIGYNYNETGAGAQTKVLVDPINLVCRYPDGDEISAFIQSGGVFVNLGRQMWERIVSRCRAITAPDPIGGGAGYTLDQLVAAVDKADADETAAILAAIAAVQTGDDAAVLAAIEKLPTRVGDSLKARL